MSEEDPDLLAGDNLDKLRGRNPYPAMSERYRLTEELENAWYQNNLLIEKCRQIEMERDEARREVMSSIIDQACRFEDVDKEYKKRGWEYLKENING